MNSKNASSLLPRLGVNIDHIATLRQLRGTPYPSLLEAAHAVENAGAQQITVHLREDRRHIQTDDVVQLKKNLKVPLNLEMAVAESVVQIAEEIKPTWACLVPEKREELTTEGGLDLFQNQDRVQKVTNRLQKAGIQVSLFIEPDVKVVELAQKMGVQAVELHTGKFADLSRSLNDNRNDSRVFQSELERIHQAAGVGKELGLHVHAGHGLDDQNVRVLTQLGKGPTSILIEEYNIGHFIVCRAAMVGLERAVREMLSALWAP